MAHLVPRIRGAVALQAMNRLSSPAYLQALRYVAQLEAHGPTPEQRTAADLISHTPSRWDRPKPKPQLSLFNPQHANPGVAPEGTPGSGRLRAALHRNPE